MKSYRPAMTNPIQEPTFGIHMIQRASRRRTLFVAIALPMMAAASLAQTISPRMVANNLWLASASSPSTTPSTTVMNLAGAAGIRLIRIGGNQYDQGMPSNQALLTWVNRIRAIGAIPLIQVSQFGSPAAAAATVEYINLTSGADVTYWSIGNEPWLHANKTQSPDPTEAQMASTIEGYFKPISAAMKEVDPTIKIFGVDSEDFQSGLHSRLFGGSNNIAGKIPGKSYYYCDGLSWHRYPQADNIDPAFQGLADIRSRIENCRTLVDNVNIAEGRSGSEALIWSIGEFNSKNGTDVHTWGNGQMFAGIYGLCMKHSADYAAAWSLYESDGKRTSTDFGMLDGSGLVPRPSYWHSQFVSRHFSGRYLEGTPSISSNSSDLLVYGAEDEEKEQVSVIILNRGTGAPRPYTLHLNNDGTFAVPGATALNVDASRSSIHQDTIPPRGTHVLVFRRDSLTRITYTNDDFIAGNPPQTTVTARSPLNGLLDAFDNYTDIVTQGYWTNIHNGDGQSSISNGHLVLRASNTAHASATIGSPVTSSFNFFERAFGITLQGFSQSSADLPADDTQFRLCLNSTVNRSFGANDSLVLRITPDQIRFGFKINQSGVQGELRAGASTAESSLVDLPYDGMPQTLRLSLKPLSTVAGVTAVHYQIQIDGSFGRIDRSGTFTASGADWGINGDSSLVLESRRDAETADGAGSYAESVLDAIFVQPLLIDDFDSYTNYSDQNYWTPLLVGTGSSLTVSASAAILKAQSLPFASAALAGTVIPELDFFANGYTLDFKDLALTPQNLLPTESYFRISLCSTAQRSFTTPDALTLLLTPDALRLGFKLDQPSTDAELRTGTSNASSFLVNEASPGIVSEVRLTLIPLGLPGVATPIFFAVRLSSSLGDTIRTGTFTANAALWGNSGDSSLVLEARRASPTTGDASSYMQVGIGTVFHTPIADDFSIESPSFAAWRLSQFTMPELGNESISGSDASPSADGVSNLLKYAFGLNAKEPVPPGALPGMQATAGNPIRFIHEERVASGDLSYLIEASADLVTWNLPVVEESRVFESGDWYSVTSRADPPPGAQQVFFRVRVNIPTTP